MLARTRSKAPMIEDHRLKAYCLVVELRSFSRAAEAKCMTQSAMSHLIRNLETEAGVELLERRGRTVVPTPAGRIFYRHARRILDQYEELEREVLDAAETARGTICLGATPTTASCLLPQALYAFARTYQEVKIDVAVMNTDQLVSAVGSGALDLAVAEGPVQAPSLHQADLAPNEIVLIAAENNPLARKRPMTARDLLAQPFILPERGSGLRQCIDDFLSAEGIAERDLNVVMTLASPELAVQMVQAGIGVAFASKWSVFGARAAESIVVLDIGRQPCARYFVLLGREQRLAGLSQRLFGEFMTSYRFFSPF